MAAIALSVQARHPLTAFFKVRGDGKVVRRFRYTWRFTLLRLLAFSLPILLYTETTLNAFVASAQFALPTRESPYVRYLKAVRPDLPKEESGEIIQAVEKAAETLAVDAQLLFALIRVESQFNRYAMSPKGALCYTQIMPNWHATALLDNIKRFRAQSIYDPEVCIITGAKILKEFIAEQGGNVERGLLRYNGSLNDPDKTYARKVFQEKARVQSIVGRE